MILQKAKGYPIKEKYQNSFSQWDVVVPKDQKDLMLWQKLYGVKCKAPSYAIKSYGSSYMHTFIIEMSHMI